MAAPPAQLAPGRDPFAAPIIVPGDRRPALPHSLDAEEAVIGGCIIRNDLFRDIHLGADDFYDPRHQAVWRAMAAIDSEGEPIDEVTIAATLQAERLLERAGGRAYLDHLGLRVPTADNAKHYAGIVADLATRRRLMEGASRLVEMARHADIDALQAEIARLDVGRVNGKANGKAHPAAAPLVRRSRPVSSLATEIRQFAKLPRLSWGGKELDRYAPFMVGGVAVIMGATGRGKTSFLLQIGRHHAQTTGPVLVVSAELIGAVAGARIVSANLRKRWNKVLEGDVTDEELARALDLPKMRIIDEIGVDILALIELEVVEFAKEWPGEPVLVLVDYLQLMPGGDEVRARVTDNIVALRKLMQKHMAGALVITKAGRTTAKEMRSGAAIGTELTEGGAETGAIEHEAMAMIALGTMKPKKADDPDGAALLDVSIVKARFGIPDKIIPYDIEPAYGCFTESGVAVSAADKRAEAKAIGEDAKVDTLVRAIRDLVSKSPAPMSRASITKVIKGGSTDKAAAILRLEDAEPPDLVQVAGDGIRKTGGSFPLWTRERAEAAGLTVVPRVVSKR